MILLLLAELVSNRQSQKLEQSLGSGGGAGRLEWSWGGKRLQGEERKELGEQQIKGFWGRGRAEGRSVCNILARFDYNLRYTT